ncbi:MAG: uracil-DNA glycosylase [Bacteroidetes bacterium]|nr:uracil-DNA glycosylase [Bacteroidota bacterium]
MKTFSELTTKIIECTRCTRLRRWCKNIAEKKVKRYHNWTYWGKPVPGFGDPKAEIIVIGLAPGAHGANRTGRLFTGDRSGDWLFRALYKAGLANKPNSISPTDGLRVTNCFITAVCRCAPPQNKPTPQELRNCSEYLKEELQLLTRKKTLICLGKVAFDTTLECCKELQLISYTKRPRFHHGVIVPFTNTLKIIGSYHPSQQNTFTGRLTEVMFDNIFKVATQM